MSIQRTDFVGYYIQNLSKQMTYLHNAMLEDIGLTYSQFRILNELWGQDEKTQNEISDQLLIKPATLSGLLVTLEKKGLVKRKRSKDDGRSKYVHLTKKGANLEEASHQIIQCLEAEVVGVFNTQERQALVGLLGKMLNHTITVELPELPPAAQRHKAEKIV